MFIRFNDGEEEVAVALSAIAHARYKASSSRLVMILFTRGLAPHPQTGQVSLVNTRLEVQGGEAVRAWATLCALQANASLLEGVAEAHRPNLIPTN